MRVPKTRQRSEDASGRRLNLRTLTKTARDRGGVERAARLRQSGEDGGCAFEIARRETTAFAPWPRQRFERSLDLRFGLGRALLVDR